MKKLLILVTLYSSISYASSYYSIETPIDSSRLDAVSQQLDQLLDEYVNSRKLAGISALIIYKGETIYKSAEGMQNIEQGREMSPTSLFRIASMTKPITSVAAMQLIEKGKLNLDDPVSMYIPAFQDAMILDPYGVLQKPANKITVRHLLMHTAGLLPQGHPKFVDASPYAKSNLEDCVNAIAGLPLFHEPEARFTYGASTNVVGRIIEVVSGITLDRYATENILKPLRMNDTYWIVPENDTTRVASMYSSDQNLALVIGPTRQSGNFPKGTSGLYSTTIDYARFAQMMLNLGELDGVRILEKKTAQLMITDLLPEALHPLNAIGSPLPNTGFGLGFAILNGNPKKWQPAALSFPNIGNLPAGSFYWPGVTGTYFWVDPFNEIVGVLLTQTNDPSAHPVFQDFHQTLYSGLFYQEKKKPLKSVSSKNQ